MTKWNFEGKWHFTSSTIWMINVCTNWLKKFVYCCSGLTIPNSFKYTCTVYQEFKENVSIQFPPDRLKIKSYFNSKRNHHLSQTRKLWNVIPYTWKVIEETAVCYSWIETYIDWWIESPEVMTTATFIQQKTLLWFSLTVNYNFHLYWLFSPVLNNLMNTVSATAAAKAPVLEETGSQSNHLAKTVVPDATTQWWSTQRSGQCVLWVTRHWHCPCNDNYIYYVFHLGYIHNLVMQLCIFQR